jgi:TIR domain
MTHEVFVSYSQPDRASALGLATRLEARGLSVWIAPRDIAPATDWAEAIIDAISAARLVVLVFSSHSNTSPQVRREVERAVHKAVPVLTYRLEDVIPSRSLEYFLSCQHWFDAFPGPPESHYERLCTHVATLLGQPVEGAPGAQARAQAAEDRAQPAVEGSSAGAAFVTSLITQPLQAPAPRSFTAQELQTLARRLAHHIGPMAQHLVKHAAADAPAWEDLVRQLAGEIDSQAARREFLAACRVPVPPAN